MANRSWSAYDGGYRATEVAELARWLDRGLSGAVVGLAGSGKSNLLGFFAARPDVVVARLRGDDPRFLPILVDLNNLPAPTLTDFFRLVLRSMNDVRAQAGQPMGERIRAAFESHRAEQDAFVSQTALRELLAELTQQGFRIALLLDRFDALDPDARASLGNVLRAMRDEQKGRMSLVAGLRRGTLEQQTPPAGIDELLELFDNRRLVVGAMDAGDALQMVREELDGHTLPPHAPSAEAVAELAGAYPALIKAVCTALTQAPPPFDRNAWEGALDRQTPVQHRLEELWEGLGAQDRSFLAAIWTKEAAGRPWKVSDTTTAGASRAAHLAAFGLLHPMDGHWHIHGPLLRAFVATWANRDRGTIWVDAATGLIYQGETVLDLPHQERVVLAYLATSPHVARTKSQIIEACWPTEESDEVIYQVIKNLRKKIEPTPSKPRYIRTWRGRPEGGYRFLPSGELPKPKA